jgi:hypothetical protein
MGNEPGTGLARLDEYAAKDYNVLRPVIDVVDGGAASSPYLVESIALLSISPKPEASETYHDFRYANEHDGKFALSSLGLAKIASAAGIKWIPELCGVVERQRHADGHVYIRFRAGAGIRQPNGEWHVETGEKEIDTADEAEKLEDTYRRKLKSGRAKFKEEDIPDMVRREILQLREHILGHAETKAKSRAIRRILALKQVYTTAELKRPFVVPKLVFRPDLADPLQLEQVQIEGRRATASLYGELPPSTTEQVGDLEFNFSGRAPSSDQPSEGPSPSDGGADVKADSTDRQTSAGGGSEKRKASASSQGDTHPPSAAPAPPSQPSTDPVFVAGPYKDQHWSEVAEQHPDYIRAELEHTRAKAKRELLQAWLDFYTPRLPT